MAVLNREGFELLDYISNVLKPTLRVIKDTFRYIRFQSPDCRGVYDNFEQAEAAVPRGKKIGYNHEELARYYLGNLSLHLGVADYPILYHLDKILRESSGRCTLFDFGGNVGVHFLRLRKHINLEKVRWVVCDVSAITKTGREACSGISNIKFINDITEFNEPELDVILASGSLQYIKSPDLLLSKLLDKGVKPRHILIDAVAVYHGPQFVTLQNGGPVYYAEYIFNREKFIKAITDLGYKLIEFWDRDKTYIIPFHREKVLLSEGYYFVQSEKMDN